MKIFVIGDPHFKNDNLYFMNWACQEILDLIKEQKPDLCVCLGDTLDTHERISLRPLHMATKLFFSISELCPLVVIIGNHDRENNNDFLTDIHPFIGLTRTENITIVDKVIWDKQKNFMYVPYVPAGRFLEALDTINYDPKNLDSKENPSFIFCHQDFLGARFSPRSSSVRSTKGDAWSENWPLVISGHIHEHQVLPGVIYVGTFVQQNYGEGTDKCLLVINCPNDDYTQPEFERISLKSVCSRETIQMDLDDLPNFSEKLPKNSIRTKDLENGEKWVSGVLVRVQLHVDVTETKTLKSNPHYAALESQVDKIDIITKSQKANLARQIASDAHASTSVSPKLEKIVQELLKDDPDSLELFRQEILN